MNEVKIGGLLRKNENLYNPLNSFKRSKEREKEDIEKIKQTTTNNLIKTH